jgi:hypothetical protein
MTPAKKSAKPSLKPKAKRQITRPAAAKARLIQAEVVAVRQGQTATALERQAFASMVATGMPYRAAFQALRPHVEPTTAATQGSRWAADMADEIARLRQTASHAAALAHGVDAAYLIGHAKAILETPLGDITPQSIYCKKYRITETMTDAGPKTTIEVEKDAPLAAVQTMAKLTGLDGGAAALAKEAEGKQQAQVDTLKAFMGQLIGPGSPIARHLAARRAEA